MHQGTSLSAHSNRWIAKSPGTIFLQARILVSDEKEAKVLSKLNYLINRWNLPVELLLPHKKLVMLSSTNCNLQNLEICRINNLYSKISPHPFSYSHKCTLSSDQLMENSTEFTSLRWRFWGRSAWQLRGRTYLWRSYTLL